MRILGINCMNHDAAMAVVEIKDGLGKILSVSYTHLTLPTSDLV